MVDEVFVGGEKISQPVLLQEHRTRTWLGHTAKRGVSRRSVPVFLNGFPREGVESRVICPYMVIIETGSMFLNGFRCLAAIKCVSIITIYGQNS